MLFFFSFLLLFWHFCCFSFIWIRNKVLSKYLWYITSHLINPTKLIWILTNTVSDLISRFLHQQWSIGMCYVLFCLCVFIIKEKISARWKLSDANWLISFWVTQSTIIGNHLIQKRFHKSNIFHFFNLFFHFCIIYFAPYYSSTFRSESLLIYIGKC